MKYITIRQEEKAICDQCEVSGRCKMIYKENIPLVSLCAVCWESLIENHKEAFSP